MIKILIYIYDKNCLSSVVEEAKDDDSVSSLPYPDVRIITVGFIFYCQYSTQS